MLSFKALIKEYANQAEPKQLDLAQDFDRFLEEQTSVFEQLIDAKQTYVKDLGWLAIDEWAKPEIINQVLAIASQVRKKADVFVLIGVGGSNNAARSVIEALQEDGPKVLYAGNTLSASAISKLLQQLEGQSVYIHCIAKNFETLEPGTSFRLLRQYLKARYGEAANERISVTGSRGSRLEVLCQEEAYQFLEFPDNIGGRFTALTSVGLLPMAVAGIDIQAMLTGARQMRQTLLTQTNTDNPAYQYACYRQFLYQAGYPVELLASFEPQLRYFNKWWLQLFAESEGKEGKGLLPIFAEYSEDLHAVGQFVQEGSPILLETFIYVKDPQVSVIFPAADLEDGFDYLEAQDFTDVNHEAYRATVEAHLLTTPVGVISIERLDAGHFGQLFYFCQYACFLSALLLKVNPFNQPGVEAYKKRLFKGLKD